MIIEKIPEWETRLKDLAKSCDYRMLNSEFVRDHHKNRFGKESKQMHENKLRFQATRVSNAEGKCARCGQEPLHENGRFGCLAQGKVKPVKYIILIMKYIQ